MDSSIDCTGPETPSADRAKATELPGISDQQEEELPDTVKARLARIRFEYDIVGSLSLELVLHIVTYLDPADIVRSRRGAFSQCLNVLCVVDLTGGSS
ncbi:hypothetical protein VTN31DRAFT_1482 [Thermomyces dupontii]|uniref:uncharacterized protein n=1 Tax=Talaromyces thermophilus TaxID=28565 RepID=UPI0037437728